MADPTACQLLDPVPPLVRPRLTLVLLLAVYAINFMDRQIVAILSEPIKREFGLSDAQIGLLYGFSFAVVYSTVGMPIARWADRANRARIINMSLALFGVMTLACGAAATYAQLLAARIGVGIGEGGTNPPSHSLIADLYPAASRGTAMSIFGLGPSLGILLGFALGGVIGQLWGWRAALLAAGTASLALAALTSRLLKDPLRDPLRTPPDARAAPPRRESFFECLRSILRSPSMRHTYIGATLVSVAGFAAIGWLPAFLIRSHGLGTAAAGAVLAMLLGGVGALGTLTGGVLADRLGTRDPAWGLRVVAIAALAAAPFWLVALLVGQPVAAIACLAVPAAVMGLAIAPTWATVQSLAEPSTRATAAAITQLVGTLFGLGLGPLLVGLLSDALQPAHGTGSLRLALLAVAPVYLWAAAHYFAASRTLAADLRARS
jgi:predicted MFS family arabinose efflux permease